MKGMEFDSIIKSDITPPDSAGLTPPAYKLMIWNGKKKIAELRVGGLDDSNQHYYTQIGTGKGYYRIKKKYLNSIPLDLNRFKAQ